MKNYYLIFFNVFFLFFTAAAQNEIAPPKIIPPGPTSQEFQRFLGYSADGSTGTTNVSIPLYTVNVPGLSIPFSLKYNSSGIKVLQSVGIVGYGWSLFPGLRITRTIMGKSDNRYKTNNIQTQNEDWNYLAQIAPKISENTELVGIDGQYDIFTLHLPNQNGSFIVQWNGTAFSAVSIPASPLKIEPINSTDLYDGFYVTDDKGIKYTFNWQEQSNNEVSSWLLTTIALPGSGTTVSFKYADSGLGEIGIPVQTRRIFDNYHKISGHYFNYIGELLIDDYSGGGYYTYSDSYNGYTQNLTQWTLSSVSFPGGNIQFSYEGFLRKMTVRNSDETVKNIAFSVDNNKLNSLSISGEGAYIMQYRPQVFSNIFDQDRWGFYNNKGNSTFIPAITLDVSSNNPQTGYGPQIIPTSFPGANNDTDTSAMKANVLEKIIYPTGGWSSFSYEPHAFYWDHSVRYGGGLRIKQINTHDPISNTTISKTYSYGASESGLAILESYPDDDSFIESVYLYGTRSGLLEHGGYGGVNGMCRMLSIYPFSRYRYFGFGTNIWYDQVTEYSDGGKIVYYYTHVPNTIDYKWFAGHKRDVLLMLNSMVFPHPNLVKKEVYKGNGGNNYSIKRREESLSANFFSSLVPSTLTGMIVDPVHQIRVMEQTYPPDNKYWMNPYSWYHQFYYVSTPFQKSNYTILTGINNLVSTKITDFSQGSALEAITTHEYQNSPEPYNLLSTTTTGSEGSILQEKYYYPTSTSIPGLSATQQAMVTTLKNANRLTTLIQKTSYKNNTELSSTRFNYADWGNNILAPESVETRKGSTGNFDTSLRYHSYDLKGNVLSFSKENGPPVSYIYSYGNRYPVAKIDNADYSTLQSVLGSQLSSFSAMIAPSESYVRSFLSPLQNHASLQHSAVSLYSYKPLVGISSVTDARGQKTTYEYDSFQRLQVVRDHDGNVLKKTDYHYKP